MAEEVQKDTGIMARTELRYRADDPADVNALIQAWKTWSAALPPEQPGDLPGDAIRRHNASRCQAILEICGLGELMEGGKFTVDATPLRAAGLKENSAAWIAAHWLGSYNRLMALRQDQQHPETTGLMLMMAEELGRLQERLWWRKGVDPQTGKTREKFAVGKRNQHKALPNATEARRIQAQDAKPGWHDDATLEARQIRERHPSYARWRIAGDIFEKYGISRNRCDKVLRENGIK